VSFQKKKPVNYWNKSAFENVCLFDPHSELKVGEIRLNSKSG